MGSLFDCYRRRGVGLDPITTGRGGSAITEGALLFFVLPVCETGAAEHLTSGSSAGSTVCQEKGSSGPSKTYTC